MIVNKIVNRIGRHPLLTRHTINKEMALMLKSILDLLFPPRCRICKKVASDPICESCAGSFMRIAGNLCTKCGKPCLREVSMCRDCSGKTLYFTCARSGGSYAGALKDAIRHLKYKNGKKLAPHLARFASKAAAEFIDDIDAIAFVPLTAQKEAKRGYNQSHLIAQELAAIYNKPLYRGLIKIKNTPDQNKLGLIERSKNVKGAFALNLPVKGKILLVDDVYTTGSTVNECARQLIKGGAKEVFVLTVARTPLDGT